MRVVVCMDGGVVNSVTADQEGVEVLIVDFDTEDCAEEELIMINGEEAVANLDETVHVDENFVATVFQEYKDQESEQ